MRLRAALQELGTKQYAADGQKEWEAAADWGSWYADNRSWQSIVRASTEGEHDRSDRRAARDAPNRQIEHTGALYLRITARD